MLSHESPAKERRPGPGRAPVLPKIKKIDIPFSETAQDFINSENIFTGFRSGSDKRAGTKLALWTWMSAFIDTLIVVASTCFAIILFSLLMKSSLPEIFKFVYAEPSLIKIFGTCFLLSFWLYLIVLRAFMGASIGEWSCQLRLGQPVQRLKAGYVLRVMLRTSFIFLTGVVLIPLLSMLLKRDLAGEISGIKIYSLI
jgi:hypothetical protein